MHICTTAEKPGNFRRQSQERRMVFFPAIDGDLPARSFLQSVGEEHTKNESSVKVKLRASLVDCDKFKNSNAILAFSWSTNSRRIHVQGPGVLIDQARSQSAGVVGDSQRAL